MLYTKLPKTRVNTVGILKYLKTTACAADFFYKMTNRANKIDKKCVNLDMEYNFWI